MRSERRVLDPHTALGYVVRLAGVALVYYLAARLGLRLALVGHSVTPLWPPTGVAVVALIAFGFRMWPAIAIAAFAVNVPISHFAAASGITAGNTLAPLFAVWLLKRAGFRSDLERVRDAVAIVFLGALAGMLVSATIGTTTLLLAHMITSAKFVETWSVWWTGDAMGVLIVAPFLWCVQKIRMPRTPPTTARIAEALLMTAALGGSIALAFRQKHPFLFPMIPVIGWVAWRFQQQGAGPAGMAASLAAILAVVNNRGPFAGQTLLDKMLLLQLFNASVGFTSFFFAAAVAEKERSREAQFLAYEREHRVSEILQRSLLPEALPVTSGVEIAARYVPGSNESQVGGDWYDMMSLPDGRIGLMIGDVAGHGIAAAAVMGQLRMAMRAYAWEELGPRAVVSRLNILLMELHPDIMSTVLYAQFDPVDGEMVFASAGHPPPLLAHPDGTVEYVEGALGPPLGAKPATDPGERTIGIEPGCTVLLYTDGLVERRDRAIDQGLVELSSAVRSAPPDIEDAADHVLTEMLSAGVADDIALLAVRRVAVDGRPFRVLRPAVAPSVPETRQLLRRWLAYNGVAGDDQNDICLAFSEAFSNAVTHAYDAFAGQIEAEACVRDGVVEVVVRDQGRWRSSREEVDGGRGIGIMNGVMDGVQISHGDSGTEVRMTRSVGTLVSQR